MIHWAIWKTIKNQPADIITAKSVEKANIFVIGWRHVTDFFSNLF